MRDLQLRNGDLLMGACGFATVDGSDYLTQRIATALQEPYGDDPYNPQWGSVLQSYIGQPIAADTSGLVSSEVARVLQQLQAAQAAQITNAAMTGTRSQYSAANILASVDSIDAAVAPGAPDIVQVAITLTTQAQTQMTITRTVTSS